MLQQKLKLQLIAFALRSSGMNMCVCVCGSLCQSCDELVTSPGSPDEMIDVNKFLIIGYRIKIETVLFIGISIGHTPSCQNTKSCDKDLHYLTTITVRTFHKWLSAPVVHILICT